MESEKRDFYNFFNWLWQTVKPIEMPMSETDWEKLVDKVTKYTEQITDDVMQAWAMQVVNDTLEALGKIERRKAA